MMSNKRTYISYVVNVISVSGLSELLTEFLANQKGKEELYEIILVNNSVDICNIENSNSCEIYVIELNGQVSEQVALRAGVAFAKGDFIYEFYSQEYLSNNLIGLLSDAQKKIDVIIASSDRQTIFSIIFSKLLKIFTSNRLDLRGRTLFTVVSRRAVNKLSDVGSHIVNRRVAYSLTGLPLIQVKLPSNKIKYRNGFFQNLNYGLETLIFYTGFIKTLTLLVSVLFMAASVCIGIYTINSYLAKATTPGWASISLFLCISFAGIFLILAVITSYLDIIIAQVTRRKDFNFSSFRRCK